MPLRRGLSYYDNVMMDDAGGGGGGRGGGGRGGQGGVGAGSRVLELLVRDPGQGNRVGGGDGGWAAAAVGTSVQERRELAAITDGAQSCGICRQLAVPHRWWGG